MMPLGKHWTIFLTTVLKSPLSAKIIFQWLREMRGYATNYRVQTERRHLRTFVISVKLGILLYFFVIHK